MMKTDPIEVEVLPPRASIPNFRGAFTKESDSLPRLIAYVMDNLLPLPGTKRRLGLNPLIDLVPVFGDGLAALISALTLYAASQSGVPRIVLARMGLNIFLNSIMGVIPGVGEVFAFWFRPNQRNYELLQKHTPASLNRRPSTRGDWYFVVALIVGTLILFAVCIAAGAWLLSWLAHSFSLGKS